MMDSAERLPGTEKTIWLDFAQVILFIKDDESRSTVGYDMLNLIDAAVNPGEASA